MELNDQGGSPNWKSVIEQVSVSCDIDQQALRNMFKAQLPIYSGLMAFMQQIGIDQDIIENSHYRIENICQQLSEL